MAKRFGWFFLLIVAAGAVVWFSRGKPEKSDSGAIPKRETSGDPSTSMSFESAGKDSEAARESSRHSVGEIERHQAEERRLSYLKQVVRDQKRDFETNQRLLEELKLKLKGEQMKPRVGGE